MCYLIDVQYMLGVFQHEAMMVNGSVMSARQIQKKMTRRYQVLVVIGGEDVLVVVWSLGGEENLVYTF